MFFWSFLYIFDRSDGGVKCLLIRLMSSVVGGNQVSITRELRQAPAVTGERRIIYSLVFYFLNRETNEKNFSFHIIPSAWNGPTPLRKKERKNAENKTKTSSHSVLCVCVYTPPLLYGFGPCFLFTSNSSVSRWWCSGHIIKHHHKIHTIKKEAAAQKKEILLV